MPELLRRLVAHAALAAVFFSTWHAALSSESLKTQARHQARAGITPQQAIFTR
jgi:hypothetical protein